MTAGISVQPTTVNAKGIQSSSSKSPDTSPVLTEKHPPPAVSKPEPRQQRISGGDIGTKVDVRVSSGSVKVQTSSSQPTYPVASVPVASKPDSPAKLQSSEQGKSDDSLRYTVTPYLQLHCYIWHYHYYY